jgi:hypothetical protein
MTLNDVRPFTHAAKGAGKPGRSAAQSGQLCAVPQSAFGELKRRGLPLVPVSGGGTPHA